MQVEQAHLQLLRVDAGVLVFEVEGVEQVAAGGIRRRLGEVGLAEVQRWAGRRKRSRRLACSSSGLRSSRGQVAVLGERHEGAVAEAGRGAGGRRSDDS